MKLTERLDAKKFRWLLSLFFLALCIPTTAVVWQAWSQLKWEAFHQSRSMAEELTSRVDAELELMVDRAEARSFEDFAFLLTTNVVGKNYVQRSPLSTFPPTNELTGALGYFQVDASGLFTTPILPAAGNDPVAAGLSSFEYDQRKALADELQLILSDNRLIQTRSHSADSAPELEFSPVVAPVPEQSSASSVSETDNLDSQLAFDKLNRTRTDPSAADEPDNMGRTSSQGTIADLKLDLIYESRSKVKKEVAPAAETTTARADGRELSTQKSSDAKRQQRDITTSNTSSSESTPSVRTGTADTYPGTVITTFESDMDPFEFSVLDSGHFVLFRKVWRDGERTVQGALIDPSRFINDTIARPFKSSSLAQLGSLVVAYHNEILTTIHDPSYAKNSRYLQNLEDALLYQTRLTAPFDAMEFIFTVSRLPPGPGGKVLGWLTLLLASVLAGGFYIMYKAGLRQIALARQQQDFVSAVSHELKTPLTSIRMYGEILKEGWADDTRKQSYYEFIHDESERLTRLINNVLQLSNITRNEISLNFTTVTVADLMQKVEQTLNRQLNQPEFTLSYVIDQSARKARLRIDEDCCIQIMINLVDNAMKFSRKADDKRIVISCRQPDDKQLVFAVRDFGSGIPKDQMKKIFQLFYRSENELTRETAGTGIGLAIVHQLSTAMGAEVDVLNQDPGAEFRVSFPVSQG